jgi:Aerotolerance regulator N-terminal
VLHLLHPAWLAAAAAIVLPVVLHLWNDRRGKVLRIGSTALLAGASQRMSWSRRLSQRWLLLVRCALLLALAALLAGPYWGQTGAADARKGWVIEVAGDSAAAGLAAGAAAYRPLIDSLVKAGYERHVLEDSVNYWDGFRVADRVAPAGIPFYIFTTGLAARFSGERPSTDRIVHWYTYTPADSVSHWIQGAWLSSPDSIRVLAGESRSTGSFYRRRSVAAAGAATEGLGGIGPAAGLTAVDTSILQITIYTEPAYRQDGRYVAAAIRALQSFTARRIQLLVTGSLPATPVRDAGWLFWLAARPLPSAASFAHVLRYEQGKERKVDTRVAGVELMKEVETTPADAATAVWRDGYGRGVLTLEEKADGGIYHFYSRFDPDWSGLVWSRSYPLLLGRLLFGEDGGGNAGRAMAEDRRLLDPGQIVPVRRGDVAGRGVVGGTTDERGAAAALWASVKGKDEAKTITAARGAIDLAPVLWILIVLLFILERVVSYSTTPIKKDG